MRANHSRRDFIKTASALGVGIASGARLPGPAEARQRFGPGNFGVLVTHTQATSGDYPNAEIVRIMVDAGIRRWTGIDDLGLAWESIFTRGVDASTRICIKPNCIAPMYTSEIGGTRRSASTNPEVVNAIVGGLTRMLGGTFPASNVTVYQYATVDKLRLCHFTAGQMPYPYVIQYANSYTKAIDVNGQLQYIEDIVDRSHYLINVPIVKEHEARGAGASCSMKNHYGSVNNAMGLHGGDCRPYIPALQLASWTDFYGQVTNLHTKTAAIIVDSLYGLFTGGPFGAPSGVFVANTILVGNDPVGIDQKGLEILNGIRAAPPQGGPLPPVSCPWIADAEALGLGSRSLSWVELHNPTDPLPPLSADPAWKLYE